VLRRLTPACTAGVCALALAACGGGSPSESPEAAAHPGWAVVVELVCPPSADPTGSLAEHKVTCTGPKGKPVEAAFYDQPVQLDRRVSTFECKTGVKSVAGKDWMVPAITDDETVSKLLDAGGINLC